MDQSMVVDARWYFNGNIKVGNIATFSTLAGDGEFVTEKYGAVRGTCGEYCKFCGHAAKGKKRPPCYVFRSYRHPSVIESHSRNTLSIINNPELAFRQLSDSLKRKRNKPVACRNHQSGEYIDDVEFFGMNGVAKENPRLPFYVYTKRYDIAVPALLAGFVPKNMTILISIWHEQGIKEYLSVAHLPNAKAFVYCDKNRDLKNGWGVEEYAEHGLVIQTFCAAYDLKGKMNHKVTCDKCKKCFNRSKNAKVVGCWDH